MGGDTVQSPWAPSAALTTSLHGLQRTPSNWTEKGMGGPFFVPLQMLWLLRDQGLPPPTSDHLGQRSWPEPPCSWGHLSLTQIHLAIAGSGCCLSPASFS